MKKGGFIFIEMLIASGLAVVIGSVCRVYFKDSVNYAQHAQSEDTLKQLNEAVDFYRSEFAALPDGTNNKEHHKAIINALKTSHLGRNLLQNETIDLNQLESRGSGDNFYFHRYQDAIENRVLVADVPIDLNYSVASPWIGDTFGAIGLPILAENLLPLSPEVEAHNHVATIHGCVLFDKPGVFVWVVPDGVNSITIQVIGGGGSGTQAQTLTRMVTKTRKVKRIQQESYWDSEWVTKQEEYTETIYVREVVTEYRYEEIPYTDYDYNGMPIVTHRGELRPTDVEHVYTKDVVKTRDYTTWESVLKYRDVEVEVEESYQVPEQYNQPGKSGTAGQIITQTISNVHGGDQVFLWVGVGGNNTNGGTSSVVINKTKVQANGGVQGGLNALEGQKMSVISNHGTGGNGQATPTTPFDRKGVCGCVQIQY